MNIDYLLKSAKPIILAGLTALVITGCKETQDSRSLANPNAKDFPQYANKNQDGLGSYEQISRKPKNTPPPIRNRVGYTSPKKIHKPSREYVEHIIVGRTSESNNDYSQNKRLLKH